MKTDKGEAVMNKGVLIVDDSKLFRDGLKTVLSREGLFGHYYEAGDGGEAIRILKAGHEIDMVLTDIVMPRVDGIDVITWLRGNDGFQDLPILVVSVDGRGDMKAMGLNLGASDYVVKPFDQVELIARIKLLLKRREVQEDLKKKNLELTKINTELKKLSVTDELTQLYNRSHFFETLSLEMKRCTRYKMEMVLMLIDLDDFKAVNDTFGHQAGDHVLKEVAGILNMCVRDSDAVGRYGGEEFIICLVHTDMEGAAAPAERIRSTVEGRVFTFPEGTYRITVSGGMTTFPGPGQVGRDELIKRADIALYEAKTTGKNKMLVYKG